MPLPQGHALDTPTGPPPGYQLDTPNGNAHSDSGNWFTKPSLTTGLEPVDHAIHAFSGDVQNTAKAVGSALTTNPVETAKHVYDMFASDADVRNKYLDAAHESIKNGEYVRKAAGNTVASLVPFIGPLLGDTADAVQKGDWNRVGDNAGHLAAMDALVRITKVAPEVAADPAVQAAVVRTAKAGAGAVTGGLKATVSGVPVENLPFRFGAVSESAWDQQYPGSTGWGGCRTDHWAISAGYGRSPRG